MTPHQRVWQGLKFKVINYTISRHLRIEKDYKRKSNSILIRRILVPKECF